MKWNKKHILIILTICLVVSGSSYYIKKVYQPNQRLTMAATLLNNGQASEADEVYRSFIFDFPQHTKAAFAYGQLFEINFSDKARSAEILKILKENYPSSEAYANSLAKLAAREIERLKPLYEDFYNTGSGKDKYFSEAKGLLNELELMKDSSAFMAISGNDLISKFNAIVKPPFGAFEFKLALSDYIHLETVTSTDKPKVKLTTSDGTSVHVQYDKETGIVSANDLAPGNYNLHISLIRNAGARPGDYFGGESLTIIPGRKYKDTTYLFKKSESSLSSDNIDRRYLALDNHTHTVSAKQVTTSSDAPVPKQITEEVLPRGYRVPENDHYLFDLDNDKQNELIAYYHQTRSLAVLGWNGKAFEEQTKVQIGSSDTKLDFSLYPISIKLYHLEGMTFPVLGLITTSGESGGYPELTLINWNGKDGYNVLWDATAGDNGEWQITKKGISMTQDNFSVGSQGNAKTRFTQEYDYDGTTFVLANAYSIQ
ncbi:MAG TPA: hypothetical protein DEF42_06615 [Desulfosporosinus sp.]|nr:hypothetical protein [Desulfosporosinus sp.]